MDQRQNDSGPTSEATAPLRDHLIGLTCGRCLRCGESTERIRLHPDMNCRPAEADVVKALLAEMRRYIIFHGLLMGECVAWNKLKTMFGVDESAICEDKTMSQKQNDGGPAFPTHNADPFLGMSLRDWFAGQALAGLMAIPPDQSSAPGEALASLAYGMADTMIAAREVKS